MITPYEVIFDRFYKKLINDDKFFNYRDLSEEEINEIVADHTLHLLNQSIDYIYSFGNPDVDFYDKDDELKEFNFAFINQEISLIVNIMHFKYIEEDINQLKVLGLTFKNSELNVFSPANERKEYIRMHGVLQNEVTGEINNYLARDRDTWEYKSVYGGD